MAPTPRELQARNPAAQGIPRLRTEAATSPKPAPQPATNPVLLYGIRVMRLIKGLGNGEAPIEERIDAAMQLSEHLPLVHATYLFGKSLASLYKAMLDDYGDLELRSACALALGVSQIPELAHKMEEILTSEPPEVSPHSKFLALKVLALLGTDDALEILALVARDGDDDGLAFAAAAELARTGLPRARDDVDSALRSRTELYSQHPELVAELRRMLRESQAN